ncbi:hypothetical protein ACFLSQ_11885, partial [Bacteroidota bacterium]
MKIKILILLSIFLLPNSSLLTQEIPDCMCSPQYLIDGGGSLGNSDNILLIDTCGIPYWFNSCDSILWYNWYRANTDLWFHLYANKFWIISFKDDVFHLQKTYPKDTTIYVTWDQIDTSYVKLRALFQQLEQNYGEYFLRKIAPDLSWDYSFFLTFSEHQNVVAINNELRKTKDLENWKFAKEIHNNASTIEDEIISNKDDFHIFPNPALSYINLQSLKKEKINIRIYNNLGILVDSFLIQNTNYLHID